MNTSTSRTWKKEERRTRNDGWMERGREGNEEEGDDMQEGDVIEKEGGSRKSE